MSIKLKDIGDVDITVNGKSTKISEREITIPTSVVKLTEEQYAELMDTSNSTTQTSSLPENVKFVPAA